MAIEKINGIYRDAGKEKLGILPSVGIDSGNLEECIREVASNKVQGVFGHPNFGFKQDNFDFFQRIPHVKQIHFWDIDIKNIDGIYCLKELESIHVEPKRPGIDFSKFNKLKKIITDYHRTDSGFSDASSVKVFHLWDFGPKEKSYKVANFPPNIEELKITKANPASLDGLPRLDNLKHLEIHYCRNLESVDAIAHIAPRLEVLIIEKCPKLINYELVNKMDGIVFLNINGETIKKSKR